MLNYNMYGIPLVGANICGYKIGDNPAEGKFQMIVQLQFNFSYHYSESWTPVWMHNKRFYQQ